MVTVTMVLLLLMMTTMMIGLWMTTLIVAMLSPRIESGRKYIEWLPKSIPAFYSKMATDGTKRGEYDGDDDDDDAYAMLVQGDEP